MLVWNFFYILIALEVIELIYAAKKHTNKMLKCDILLSMNKMFSAKRGNLFLPGNFDK